jgi:hypothetical protein|tara:strand:+ start:3556 stop:3681 length:126 start_codon:yes stop_codon:yes gene_type:complete
MIKLTPELKKKIEDQGKKLIPITLEQLSKAKKLTNKNKKND